jgi:hypothetical protein
LLVVVVVVVGRGSKRENGDDVIVEIKKDEF